MSNLPNINIQTFHVDRELRHCPKHFVKTKTVVTSDSYNWILEKTVGRFVLLNLREEELELSNVLLGLTSKVPAFEDSSEAMLYELTWS